MTPVKQATPAPNPITSRWLVIALAATLLLAASGAMAQSGSPTNLPTAAAPDESHNGINATFSYLWLAGSTFHSTSTPGSHAYASAGCIYQTTVGQSFHHKLLLPEGSLVKYVRMYYRNSSASNSPNVYFTTYDMVGGITDHATVAGPSTSGYSSTLSGEMNYTVDPYAEPINIDVSIGGTTGSGVQFCGVRVAYYAPELEDDIFKDGFE